MKRVHNLVWCLVILCHSILVAQRPALKVGNNPATIHNSSVLEVESTTKGFLPPRMTNAQMQAIPSPAQGLIVYCTDCNPVGLMENDGTPNAPNWQSPGGGSPSATVVANCNTAGFNTGTYIAGTALVGRTFTVTLTNNTFSTAIITFAPSDLVLSGLTDMNNLAVGTPTGSPTALVAGQATLTAGQSVTVTYPITGTPGSCGTLQGVWTKLSLSCTKIVGVGTGGLACSSGSWTTPISPSVSGGLVNNTAYSGSYSIPNIGGNCNLQPESITISGLTLSTTGGILPQSGNLVYTLSGTYTGTTGQAISFTTANGCTILVGILASCKAIKTQIASSTNGIYWIDPDGASNTIQPMQVRCDMTSHGGGWTLIAKSMTNNADFHYDNARWTTGATLNPTDFDISSTNTTNAFYNAYNSVLANEVFVDFVTTADLSVFSRPTAITPRAMATGAEFRSGQSTGCQTCFPWDTGCVYSFEAGAQAIGFNIQTFARVRFGGISNNEQDFNSVSSGIGFGLSVNEGNVGMFAEFGSGNALSGMWQGCGTSNRSIGTGFLKALLWVR